MPITFSDQLMLFAVKGEEPDDTHEVSRSAADTRPLSLKNTDNKIIARVNNYLAKRMLAASAVDIQRGFVPGRQLVANVLELDTCARWFGAAGHETFDQCGPSPGVTPHDLFSGSVDPAAIRPRVRVAPEETLQILKMGGAQERLKEKKGGTQERLKEQKGGSHERLKEIKKGGAQESLKENGEWPREPHSEFHLPHSEKKKIPTEPHNQSFLLHPSSSYQPDRWAQPW
jgi:hypothetical protein